MRGPAVSPHAWAGAAGRSGVFLGDSLATTPREAWSVHEIINSAYYGSLITVRRSGDNATMAFGAGATGRLNGAALVAWVVAGGGTQHGYVTAVHGQYGGLDLSQASTTLQPRIVVSGALVTNNGIPCLKTGGASDRLTRPDALGLSGATDIAVMTYTRNLDTDYRRWMAVGASAGQFALAVTSSIYFIVNVGDAYRLFSVAAAMSADARAYVAYLASGAQVGTAVARQDGSVLSQFSTNLPTTTLSVSDTLTTWGGRGINGTTALMESANYLVFDDLSNIAADAAAFEAYMAAEASP